MKKDKLSFKKSKNLPILLTLLVLVSWFSLTLVLYRSKASSPRLPAVLQGQTGAGVLSLSATPSNVDVGNTTALGLTLDTGGEQIHGVDVLLQYDSSKLQVTQIIPSTTTTLSTFAPLNDTQNGFDWPKAVNAANSTIEFGAVTFDLLAPSPAPRAAFAGSTPLATIDLQARPVRRNSDVPISFQAQANQTNDSNIVNAADGGDILGTANPVTVRIRAEAVCRAAVLADTTVGSDDIMAILNNWDRTCSGCFEDADGSGRVGSGDIMLILNQWSNRCTAS